MHRVRYNSSPSFRELYGRAGIMRLLMGPHNTNMSRTRIEPRQVPVASAEYEPLDETAHRRAA